MHGTVSSSCNRLINKTGRQVVDAVQWSGMMGGPDDQPTGLLDPGIQSCWRGPAEVGSIRILVSALLPRTQHRETPGGGFL